MPDPKLKLAADEIKAVLRRHDIAGTVFLGSKAHTEFLFHLPTTWNLIREADEGVILIQYKKADATPEKDEALRLTVGLIAGFRDAMRATESNFMNLLASLGKSMDIQHWSQLEEDEK